MVGLAALGSLVLRMRSSGLLKASKDMKTMGKQSKKMEKQQLSMTKKLTKSWKAMGVAALGVLYKLSEASPRLSAQMEIMNLRINELLRGFGDALAPVIETVSKAIKGLTDWFYALDPEVQNAIKFGTTLAIVVGLAAVAFGVLSAAISPVTIALIAIALVAAALYLAWKTNFLGIQEAVAFVFAYIKFIIEAWINVIKNFVSRIKGFIDNFIGIFHGIINFFKAVFAGDLDGAIKAIQDIFVNAFKYISGVIMWPLNALGDLIDGFTNNKFLDDMLKAGKAFIDAFIKGIQKAIDDATGVVKDVLEWFGSFFGGSLPERGPLRHVVSWGQDFGQAYTTGVGAGMSTVNTSRIVNRNFNIDTIEINPDRADVDDLGAFGDRIENSILRGQS
jgi:phage-related protein